MDVAEPVAGEAPAHVHSACFHCGLPVPKNLPVASLEVLGEPREFCCHGCHAVCKAIVDAGLDDYYRHRTDPAVSASRELVPDFLRQLELFDRPDIQQDFVTEIDDAREAALLLDNIRCPACLWLNERHLRSLPGVIDVHIDDTTQRARVRWDPQTIRLSEILRAITDIGYIAHPFDASRSEQLNRLRRQRSTERLIFAGAVGMLVMNFSLASYVMVDTAPGAALPLWVSLGRWTSLLLSMLLLAWPGQEFFIGAWNDLRHRRLGMDVPVVLGLSAAFIGSLHATLTGHGDVYFDSIAMFIFFLLLARRWELRGKLSAASRLERLARVTPRTATRLNADDTAVDVAVEELAAGDTIRVLPGETLPVDGSVLTGTSSFDESLLTGEAHPVVCRPGDSVRCLPAGIPPDAATLRGAGGKSGERFRRSAAADRHGYSCLLAANRSRQLAAQHDCRTDCDLSLCTGAGDTGGTGSQCRPLYRAGCTAAAHARPRCAGAQ